MWEDAVPSVSVRPLPFPLNSRPPKLAALVAVASLVAATGAGADPWLRAANGLAGSVPTVRLVVSVPPGSGADVTARVLAEGMERALGQPVIVENRPGADGIIAVRALAEAPPDGTVLLYGLSGQFVVNPATRSALPYDPMRDAAPVTLVRFSVSRSRSMPRCLPTRCRTWSLTRESIPAA